VISIALLVIGIMLGKGISFSPTQKSVAIRLATSGGIDAGSPVVVNGVRRGTVTQVSNDNGGVLVTATLDDVSDLRSDAQALVSILEITGGKKIELTPGSAATALNPSAEIPINTTNAKLAEIF
jgi:phospholipid/cholesterol/gamma-HCH transport system substrate-binding protein